MRWQWIRCLLGLHARDVYSIEDVTNYKGEIEGKNVISRCGNCGRITVKYVSTRIEDVRTGKF